MLSRSPFKDLQTATMRAPDLLRYLIIEPFQWYVLIKQKAIRMFNTAFWTFSSCLWMAHTSPHVSAECAHRVSFDPLARHLPKQYFPEAPSLSTAHSGWVFCHDLISLWKYFDASFPLALNPPTPLTHPPSLHSKFFIKMQNCKASLSLKAC